MLPFPLSSLPKKSRLELYLQNLPAILEHGHLGREIFLTEIQRPDNLHGASTQLDALTHNNALGHTVNGICFAPSMESANQVQGLWCVWEK